MSPWDSAGYDQPCGQTVQEETEKKVQISETQDDSSLQSSCGLTAVIALFGAIFILNILDPYSLYGKVATGLFRPAAIWLNNGLAGVLEKMNVFALFSKDISLFRLSAIIFPVIILLVLIYMAGKYGRLYCNTVCPVGTLLGWIIQIFPFPDRDWIRISCIKCGKCAFSCKSGCISIKNMTVDHSRCVACYRLSSFM